MRGLREAVPFPTRILDTIEDGGLTPPNYDTPIEDGDIYPSRTKDLEGGQVTILDRGVKFGGSYQGSVTIGRC